MSNTVNPVTQNISSTNKPSAEKGTDSQSSKNESDISKNSKLRLAIITVKKNNKPSKLDVIVMLVKENTTLFYDKKGNGYVEVPVNNHKEIYPINSKSFQTYASNLYYSEIGSYPSKGLQKEAIHALSGIATIEGNERAVYMRCAKLKNSYYIDLCRDDRQVVEITPSGWNVINKSPVSFIRNENMRTLPLPIKGKSDLGRITKNTNLFGDNLTLTLAFTIEAYRSDTPYALLNLKGKKGTAKSTTQDFLRNLIDPNNQNLRSAPKNAEDIFVSAQNSHMYSLNNMSAIPKSQEDALCVLLTGGARFTDNIENVYDVKSPVIMNGIDDITTASDLADRLLNIELPILNTFISEQVLKVQAQQDAPVVFAGFMDLFSEILKEIKLNSSASRMVDFQVLGDAMVKTSTYKKLNLSSNFSKVYSDNKNQVKISLIESSPTALALITYLTASKKFEGRVGELLDALVPLKNKGMSLPRSPRKLTGELSNIASALEVIGINISHGNRTAKGSSITITKTEAFSKYTNP